jgi:hypothetical protein
MSRCITADNYIFPFTCMTRVMLKTLWIVVMLVPPLVWFSFTR